MFHCSVSLKRTGAYNQARVLSLALPTGARTRRAPTLVHLRVHIPNLP